MVNIGVAGLGANGASSRLNLTLAPLCSITTGANFVCTLWPVLAEGGQGLNMWAAEATLGERSEPKFSEFGLQIYTIPLFYEYTMIFLFCMVKLMSGPSIPPSLIGEDTWGGATGQGWLSQSINQYNTNI